MIPVPMNSSRLILILLILVVLMSMGCASNVKPVERTSPGHFAFWPPYPAEPRLQYLVSYDHSGDVAPVRSSVLADIVYGRESEPTAGINKPYGVAMRDGRIYVCDIRSAGIFVFDLRRKQTRVMGVSGLHTVVRPVDVAIADDGMIYVADIGRDVVFVFSPQERYVTMFGRREFKPAGLAVHGDRLYVACFIGQCIDILDRRTGELVGRIGERPEGWERTPGWADQDGQFVRPLGVAVDGHGNVWTTDAIRCRVQKFSPEGELLVAFGEISNRLGAFVRPKHIAVGSMRRLGFQPDEQGQSGWKGDPSRIAMRLGTPPNLPEEEEIVYVVDSAFQNVQVFDSEGHILTFFGAAGDHPGSMYLPVGVAVHRGDLDLFEQYVHPAFRAEHLILVTNQFGPGKVSVYAFGQLREGRRVEELIGQTVEVDLGVGAEDNEGAPGPMEEDPWSEGTSDGR